MQAETVLVSLKAFLVPTGAFRRLPNTSRADPRERLLSILFLIFMVPPAHQHLPSLRHHFCEALNLQSKAAVYRNRLFGIFYF